MERCRSSKVGRRCSSPVITSWETTKELLRNPEIHMVHISFQHFISKHVLNTWIIYQGMGQTNLIMSTGCLCQLISGFKRLEMFFTSIFSEKSWDLVHWSTHSNPPTFNPWQLDLRDLVVHVFNLCKPQVGRGRGKPNRDSLVMSSLLMPHHVLL